MLGNGMRDRQITFQVGTDGKDAVGAKTITWANVDTDPTPWACVVPLSGREMEKAGHIMSEDVRKFTVLYRTDITVKHRILFEGKTFAITRIDTLGRYEELAITAKAVA